MSDLRAAAQQALEALDSLWQRGVWGDFHGVADNLRATLVEDAMQKFTDVNQELEAALGCDHCNQPLYAAIKCRVCGRVTQAEPVQEPQRTPLTDGQIHDCFQQKHKDKVTERRMITRAIERAHGIKDA